MPGCNMYHGLDGHPQVEQEERLEEQRMLQNKFELLQFLAACILCIIYVMAYACVVEPL